MPRTVRCASLDASATCELCGVTLSRKDDLKRHMKIHSAIKELLKHRCPVDGCMFSALQWSNLLTHMRKHTGEKLLCPSCEFATSDGGSLTRHRKKAHGYRPRPRRRFAKRGAPQPYGPLPSSTRESGTCSLETLPFPLLSGIGVDLDAIHPDPQQMVWPSASTIYPDLSQVAWPLTSATCLAPPPTSFPQTSMYPTMKPLPFPSPGLFLDGAVDINTNAIHDLFYHFPLSTPALNAPQLLFPATGPQFLQPVQPHRDPGMEAPWEAITQVSLGCEDPFQNFGGPTLEEFLAASCQWGASFS